MIDPNTTALLKQLGVDPGVVEMVLSGLLVFTVVTLLAAIPTAIIAKRRRRSQTLWLLFALSIPLLPLLLVWMLPALPVGDEPPKESGPNDHVPGARDGRHTP